MNETIDTKSETIAQRVAREARESMIPATELVQSFDARVWAREIGLDEEGALTTWFANALMPDYDEAYFRSKEYKRSVRSAMHPWYSWRRYFTPLSKFGR